MKIEDSDDWMKKEETMQRGFEPDKKNKKKR